MAKDKPVLRGVYVPRERKRYQFVPIDDGRVRAEFQAECDINTIMAKYQKTGVLTHVNRSSPQYVDFSDVPDFQSSMNFMLEAEAAFMRLPARARESLGNDPSKFVQFAVDPANVDKMREWGLAPPAPAPDAPMKVEVVNPSPGQPDVSGDRPKGAGKPPTQ